MTADHPEPARSRYREYLVAAPDMAGDIYSGFGVTLDEVIEKQARRFGRDLAHAVERDGETPESFTEDFPDLVVWDRGQVVAVLRPTPGGEMDVVRFGLARSGRPR